MVIKDTSTQPLESSSDGMNEPEHANIDSGSNSIRLDVASASLGEAPGSRKKSKMKRPSALTIQIFVFFAFFVFIQIASRGTSNSMSMIGIIFMYMVVTFFISIFRKKRNNSKEQ